jgi:hypothetical protein
MQNPFGPLWRRGRTEMLYKVYHPVGCDPELFITQGAKIVGSERVLPPEGLAKGLVVRDGVQVELHPSPQTWPDMLVRDIGYAISQFDSYLKQYHPDTRMSFTPVVNMDPKELGELSEKARILGCEPSENVYGLPPLNPPAGYLIRSAGGHIHLDVSSLIYDAKNQRDERYRLIPLLDALVGIPSVLIDRDPIQKERRKMYGRAGEYRNTAYGGVEYRTLSNFWLRHKALSLFVFQLSKMALDVLQTSIINESLNPEGELMSKLNIKLMIEAIQNNDANVARGLWADPIKPFILKWCQKDTTNYPLNQDNIDRFEKFLAGIQQHGLAHFMPVNITAHWGENTPTFVPVWQRFLESMV